MRTRILSVFLALLIPAGVIAATLGISTNQTRTAAPTSVNLSGSTASEGSSLAHARADHVHSVTVAITGTETPGKIMRENLIGFSAYITTDATDCYVQQGFNATTGAGNCVRRWAGAYYVTFTSALSATPICVASSLTENRIIDIVSTSTTTVYWFAKTTAGTAVDSTSIHLICVGS